MDKRTSIGVAGDLGKYTEFSAAEAMTKAASNPGGDGGMGAGRGMGLGMAMAGRLAQSGPWGTAPGASAAPPPPPPEPRWHVAQGGTAHGPFARAQLAEMAQAGTLTPESQVWTPGSAGWMRAGEVAALADVLRAGPPPLPPTD